MSEILEKAASKLAELEIQKAKIESEMKTKASAEEVEVLRTSLSQVSESIAAMMSAIEGHTQVIESLQVVEAAAKEEAPAEKALKSFKKENLMKLKENKFINLGGSVAELNKFVKKAVTADYAGTVATLPTIDYLNVAMRPTLLSLFTTRPAPSGTIQYLDMTPVVDNTASNGAAGCYLPDESEMTLDRNTQSLVTYRNWVTVCDTHLEDYTELAPSISELMLQGLVNQVDLTIEEQLDINAIANTTLPSYTSLAGDIDECNIYDLMLVHTADMLTVTRGKFAPNYMLLNPVTAAGLMATKSANTYLLQQQLGLNGMAMPIIFTHPLIAADKFYLVSDRCGIFYTGRDASIELANQDASQFRQGIVTVRGSERGLFLMTLISSYGAIKGTISTSLANYEKP
jgi:hypothetical protein